MPMQTWAGCAPGWVARRLRLCPCRDAAAAAAPGEEQGLWPGAACKADIDAFLECGILVHGFLRLRCSECGHDKLLALSCKRRGFCPSCAARRMSQTAVYLVDHVIPHVPGGAAQGERAHE